MDSNKTIFISIIIGGAILGSVLMLTRDNSGGGVDVPAANNVALVSGTQVVTIDAKGGYSPRVSKAKADMPTVLKMETKGTFDCSSALSIPALSYQGNLPPTGVTEIEVPAQKAGTKLRGSCAMGMYHFEIDFE